MLDELGANVLEDGTLGFLVWAPLRETVELEMLTPVEKTIPMEALGGGYFKTQLPDPGGDVRYLYVLDGSLKRPDPASRFQPEGVDVVKLNTNENPYPPSPKVIKAIRVKCEDDIQKSLDYSTDAVLLDAYHPELYGGTGDNFDWNLIGYLNRRVFLAGGINPENAAKAIEVGVYGIDVCSGIEKEPGVKDHEKMRRLFDNIRHLIA